MAYAELDLAGERIVVQTRYEEKELIKSIPGSRYDPTEKHWTVPLTWPACLQLRGVFGATLTIGEKVNAWAANERATRIDYLMKARELLTAPDGLIPANEGLYGFQAAGSDFMVVAEQALLGDEMGTGKTIQLLEALRWRFITAGSTLPALIVCPNSTKTNWQEEAYRWFPEAKSYVITGGAIGRKKLLKAAASDPNALVIVNFEAVRSHSRLAPYGSVHLVKCSECDRSTTDNGGPAIPVSRCEKHPRELNEIEFTTVVVDEAHRMKDPKSKQTRAIWACGQNPSVRFRYALTGTPIANDPSDLWSIMHSLAPLEHPTKTKFVDRYCLQTWNAYGGLSVVGVQPQTREEFQRVIGPRFRRVTKAEVLTQLPPKQRTIIRVDMTPKQRKAYQEMETNLVARVDGGIVVAPSNLTAQIRLLQFAAAECSIEPDGTVKMTSTSPKIDALMDQIDAARGKPVVVSAEHRQLIELAAARLAKEKIEHVLITGAVGEWDRKNNLKRFQAGEVPVLLFTLKAGGTGLTMTAADTQICIQRSWSMVDNKQAEDRVHRIGSEIHKAINIVEIVMNDTVEETVLERYVEKMHRMDQITQDRARMKARGLDTTELDELEALLMNSWLGDR